MKSLKSKIQTSLVGSIVVIAVIALIMLWINQLSSLSNQKIISTMTTEYSIISLSEKFAQKYNEVTKNPDNTQHMQEYQTIRTQLLDTLEQLDKNVTRPESRTLLLGINNTVQQIIKQGDAGIAELKQSDYANLSEHYAQINKINVFIDENTKTLLGKELEYLYATQQRDKFRYYLTTAISFGVFIAITIGMIVAARSFSNQLIKPLQLLSIFAKDVAGGNLHATKTKALQITEDEIGSLTISVYTMVEKLIAMLSREQQVSEEMKKTSVTIANNNTELQKMNTLMVGRELKMTELKKEIEELKSKLNASQAPKES